MERIADDLTQEYKVDLEIARRYTVRILGQMEKAGVLTK